jgi:hypothetical protein
MPLPLMHFTRQRFILVDRTMARLVYGRYTPLIIMPLLSPILMDTGSKRIIVRAKGDGCRMPTEPHNHSGSGFTSVTTSAVGQSQTFDDVGIMSASP